MTVSENNQQLGLEANKSASPNNSQNTQASVSNDDVLTPQDRESVASRLREYVLENPGSALSICVLTFGGLLLLVYFLRIGFLPDIALESVTTLLYAVSILGLFILVIFAAYLVMPAFVAKAMWQDYQEQGKLSVTWVFGLSGGAAFFAWPISLFGIIVLEKSVEPSFFISLATVILIVFLLACFLASRTSEANSKSAKEDANERPKAGAHPIWIALRVAATAFVQWTFFVYCLLDDCWFGSRWSAEKDRMAGFIYRAPAVTVQRHNSAPISKTDLESIRTFDAGTWASLAFRSATADGVFF